MFGTPSLPDVSIKYGRMFIVIMESLKRKMTDVLIFESPNIFPFFFPPNCFHLGICCIRKHQCARDGHHFKDITENVFFFFLD